MKAFTFFILVLGISILGACGGSSDTAPVDRAAVEPPLAEIVEISPADARKGTEAGNVQFIDVRDEAEYRSGHASKAVNIPLSKLETEMAKLDKSRPVYLICQTGLRSRMGAETLRNAGFSELYNVAGGTTKWEAAGLPLDK